MKKILTVIFLACAFVFAQEGSIKPEFQAFSGALIKLKKAEHGFHKFRLRVDVAPWSFLAEGEVQAPGGDSDVLITALFDRALYAVLAYSQNLKKMDAQYGEALDNTKQSLKQLLG